MAVIDEHERLRKRQRTNIIVAKFIPVFLILVVAYASYVFVGPLCVNYLLNAPPDAGVQRRMAIGIALPIVFFLLLILMASCYFRLLYIVSFAPGYVPQHSTPVDNLEKPIREKKTLQSCVPTHVTDGQELAQLDYEGILRRGAIPPPGTEEFYSKDAFVCDRNGLPMWCHTCGVWKADRVHHSRDVGRCVKKMDHFCPWVGGMVGENGYKFFVQFNIYAATFSLYAMIVMAYFIAEAERKTGTVGDVQWVVVLGLGGFFAVFTAGLAMTSIQLTLSNLTTVENIDKGARSMYIAVILPPDLQGLTGQTPSPTQTPSRTAGSELPLTSEIDDPSHASYFSSERPSRPRRRSRDELAASIWQGTITYPLGPEDHPVSARRTFAILKTPQGMNPWDIGWRDNLTSVFGTRVHSWVLPFLRSPCTRYSSDVSRYPLGWQFEQMLSDARMIEPPDFIKEMNGERPDGWALEKELRRVRREQREIPVLPP
ncbi:hypothetical protein AMS68_000303 [Peltaster fructicola]|uniref:Palmitoyltransferase n=1 Tax=Peltaster fructicola TaxID=286661 RepID=A0A6H0XJ93_9PEZI|nr:hypothetical protein AMS68_000303 [Peltaster fructicola]